MPEGPEVKTISDVLSSEYTGKELVWFEIGERSRYHKTGKLDGKHTPKLPAKLLSVSAYGKKILFRFDGWLFISLLGMSGTWVKTPGKHSGIKLVFGRRTKKYLVGECGLYFEDPRHQGRLYCDTIPDGTAFIQKYTGPDLLSGTVTQEMYFERLRRVKGSMMICKFLMEQKYFSGVGNYLKAEILYQAKIAPHRELQSLSDDDVANLYQASIQHLTASYQSGGLTIADYKDPNGKIGVYQTVVYGKSQDPLGNPVVKEKIGKDTRTTHWVPGVQV